MGVGANLRFEPGIVLKFNKPSTYPRIIVEGSLYANGNTGGPADSLITFTSQYDDAVGNPADTEGNGTATTPDDGQWGFIKFASTSNDGASLLDQCVFSYGGQDISTTYRGAVWCNSASPTITNCEFNTNETGIRTDGNASPLIQANHFFNNAEVPLATSVVSNPNYVDNTFNQNQYHVVGILQETLAQDAVLERVEVGGPPDFPEFFPYMHLGTLTIGTGSTLTIQPAVVVKVLSSHRAIDVNGGLRILGKSDSLVVYTSIKDDSYGGDSNVDGSTTSPASGNWDQIRFNSTTLDATSLIENCLLRFGSAGNRGVIELQSASPTIQDCTFEINRYGLWIQNASDPVVQNNFFRLTDVAPISKSVLAQPTFSGNIYDNNAYDVLGLIGEDIAQDLTLTTWNVAGYTNITRALVSATMDVNFGATLTIDPGVVVKMGPVSGGPFQNHWQVSGAVDANGTELQPIVFTSIRDDSHGNPADSNNDGSLTTPNRYDWYSFDIKDISDDATNQYDWCIFSYGGYSGYGVDVQTASPTFTNCTFEKNNNFGLRIRGDSQPVITNCTFGGHLTTPIGMSLGSDPVFSGNTFETDNAYSALGILGETLASDVRWKRRSVAHVTNIPYILTGNLTAGLSSILRIDPGVVIKPLSGIDITVERGLIAEGKAEAESLIVFTSPYDDFYGGDTNNDAGDTEGSDLRWGNINIANEAIDDSTRFSNCVFRFSTNGSTGGALSVTNANPQVSHCIFTQNGVGINYLGAAGDPLKGSVNDCDIFANTYYGIKNTGMSFVIDATNNWWGDATGPHDPSDDTGSGGWYNPGGLGDEVTDKVDYTGYKTSGVQNLLLGDVSLNGEVRAYDSSLILQDLALVITLSSLQQTVADVNCSGTHSTLDASLILRLVAGLDTYFPCSYEFIPKRSPVVLDDYPGSKPGDFRVAIPAFEISAGQTATVPIELSGTGEVLGHEYRVAFDPAQLEIEDVRLLPAAEGATLYWNATQNGELGIALASAQLLEVGAAVEIVLRAQDDLPEGVTPEFELTRARINEQDLLADQGQSGQEIPRPTFWLGQNYPNPFNPRTTIEYSVNGELGASQRVDLRVYDLKGRLVRQLVAEPQVAGIHTVTWNGVDDAGRKVASGVYFYRLRIAEHSATYKMLLIK
jgi:parallel beta-helix repeat protein